MVKEEGPRYGLAQQASAIEKTANGRYVVRDPTKRAEILKLRDDPNVSALMAGALAEPQRRVILPPAWGGSPLRASSISRIFSVRAAPAS